MIVKESPTPTKTRNDTTWPPRSPLDAALSSPSKQRKLQARHDRTSVSPSPSRPNPQSRLHMEQELSGDEDEETLQLQLEAIKARLKLKKLQKVRAGDDANTSSAPSTLQRSQLGPASARARSQASSTDERGPSKSNVEIAVSPDRRPRPVQPADSPRRVQLGIDKGLKAAEVSLKRVGSHSSKSKRGEDNPRQDQTTSSSRSIGKIAPSKNFSERLSDARSQDIKREENQIRRQKSSSKGFGVSESFLNDEAPANLIKLDNKENIDKAPRTIQQSAEISRTKSDGGTRSRSYKNGPQRSNGETDTAGPSLDFDSYSRFHLSKRHMSQSKLSSAFEEKTLISIPQLLKTVTAPDYDPPDVENDYVVFGIIASKSSPLDHADKQKIKSNGDPDDPRNNRTKFMSVRLTDLQWEVNLFLFDTAFDAFWRLPIGTVIAILNPDIMPPKPHMRDTGQFSLKLSSSEDTVLEIGSAKDLYFCKSVKKDGKECGQWVDRRKTEFCEFHVSLKADKAKAGRMEINGMVGLGSYAGTKSTKSGRGRKNAWRGGRPGKKDEEKEGAYYDYEAHELAYGIPSKFNRGKSTSKLLDAEDYAQGGLSKEERSRKRLAAQEKEHDLAKKLGALGGGLGGEYMRLKQPESRATDHEGPATIEEHPDAQSLGLVRSSADIKLGQASMARAGRLSKEAVGWSHAFKRGLPSPTRDRSPEKIKKSKADNHSPSPSKQARFMLEDKGLRVPGRESLPGLSKQMKAAPNDFDDDDDDLDIV